MQWKHLNLSIKFSIGFGIVLILLGIVGFRAIFGINGIVVNAGEVIAGNELRAEMMRREVDHLNWAARVSALLTDDKVTRLNVQTNPRQCALGKWYYSDRRRKAEKLLPQLKSFFNDLEAPHIDLHESAIALGNKYQEFMAGGEGAAQAEIDAKLIYTDKTMAALKKIQGLLRNIREVVDQNVMTDEEMLKRAASTRQTVIIIGALALVTGSLLAFLIARGITRPMNAGIRFARKLSEGKLSATIDVDQDDEVGKLAQALTDMAQRLRGIVAEVTTVSENVASGSEELSATAQELSQGAAEQASSAKEVSASMEQMTANIKQNSENALQTETLAKQSAVDASESGKAMNETLSAMREITEKITIVQSIARKTNLLALNAAIEAARAGEHGKGFAVVASEVSQLAERSQMSAGEITELARTSVAIAEKAGEMLNQLVPDIQKTANLVQEISAGSYEQKNGTQQINTAIQQLDKVVQQNAGSAEVMASTAEQLSSQAKNLQRAISFFKLDHENHRDSPEPRVRQAQTVPPRPAFDPKASASPALHHQVTDSEDEDFERF